jgi:hypothetical protein
VAQILENRHVPRFNLKRWCHGRGQVNLGNVVQGQDLERPGEHRASVRIKNLLNDNRVPTVVAVLAMLLALPALWCGLQFDDTRQWLILQNADHPINLYRSQFTMFHFADGDPDNAQYFMDLGFYPWWTLKTVRLTFCRPITVLTHIIDHSLWPNAHSLMHLHSLFWLAGLVAVVALLYRRVMGACWVAGLAALLYAIDDGHAMPAGWVANRNGLIAAFFGLLAVLLHTQWRRRSSIPAAFLAPVCLVLGLLSNEGAIGACAYLFAFAVFLDHGSRWARALTLAPYVATVIAWRITYSALGYGVWGSATYIDPLLSPSAFLKALVIRVPVLLLGQWALPPSDFFLFLPPIAQSVLWTLGIGLAVILMFAMSPLLRQNAVARFWALGMVLALIPASTTFPTDRLMLFAGVGAMGLLAQFLDTVFDSTGPRCSKRVRFLAYTFLALHVVLAPILLPARIVGVAAVGNMTSECMANAPLDDNAVTGQTVVFASAPNIFLTSDLINVRALHGKPLPKHIRSLAPNSVFPVPIRLTRTNAHTLVVEPEGGYPWFLVRDDAHSFEVGEVVEIDGMTVEVLSLTETGYPHRVAFTFDADLEDPSLVWLQFQDMTFVPFTPPGIGESVDLGTGTGKKLQPGKTQSGEKE